MNISVTKKLATAWEMALLQNPGISENTCCSWNKFQPSNCLPTELTQLKTCQVLEHTHFCSLSSIEWTGCKAFTEIMFFQSFHLITVKGDLWQISLGYIFPKCIVKCAQNRRFPSLLWKYNSLSNVSSCECTKTSILTPISVD